MNGRHFAHRRGLSFASLGRKKIAAGFRGGRISSDSGGLLLREVDCRIVFIDSLAEYIADPRDPAKITHELRTLLAQRIFAIALGYEDLNDHEILHDDPLTAVLTGQTPNPDAPLGSPATLCRLENRAPAEPLPNERGFALIGNPYGPHVVPRRPRFGYYRRLGRPDLHRVVLDPAWARQVLSEFPLLRRADIVALVEQDRPRAGRSVVQRYHVRHRTGPPKRLHVV
jgi:hypothetical protein